MKAILVVLITLFPILSSAQNLSGVWKTPSGYTMAVVHESRNIVIGMAINTSATGFVKLVFEGSVGRSPVNGNQIILADAQSFPIIWLGKRCVVQTPIFAVSGNMVGQVGGRRFHASRFGAISASVICGGVPETDWGIDISGIWR